MLFIGLTGKAGSGKSTAAQLLKKMYSSQTKYEAMILPFAKALKEKAQELGWNGLKDEKGRRLLQLLGTDICRECINPNYWLIEWEQLLQQQLGLRPPQAFANLLVIADDVRFDNEAQHIRSSGGLVISVAGRQDTACPQHSSEAGIDPLLIDFLLDNSEDLAFLEKQCQAILDEVYTAQCKGR